MTHQFTATQASIAPLNSSHVTTGGQACDKKSRNMFKDAQIVSKIKSTHAQYVLHSNQSTHDQKRCCSR